MRIPEGGIAKQKREDDLQAILDDDNLEDGYTMESGLKDDKKGTQYPDDNALVGMITTPDQSDQVSPSEAGNQHKDGVVIEITQGKSLSRPLVPLHQQ